MRFNPHYSADDLRFVKHSMYLAKHHVELAMSYHKDGDYEVAANMMSNAVDNAVNNTTNNYGQQGSQNIIVELDGKKVVVVDDVLFTGRTIRAAIEVAARAAGSE